VKQCGGLGGDNLTRARRSGENRKFDIEANLQSLGYGSNLAHRWVATPRFQRSNNGLGHFHSVRQLQLGQPEVFASSPDASTHKLRVDGRPTGTRHFVSVLASVCPGWGSRGIVTGSNLDPSRGGRGVGSSRHVVPYLLSGHYDPPVAVRGR
jgi:hypothetical protein